MQNLPYFTSNLPGVGGAIKKSVEDFRVEEIPAYLPCGKGTHTFFRVTKIGVPTPVAVDRIARHMGTRPTEIGIAGLKDSQAITAQWMSLEYADPKRLERFNDKQVRISDISRHGNKLKIGHLAGNKFRIRIRDVGDAQASLARARAILDILLSRGVPNYFGSQRFGARGDTGLLGAAMVNGDLAEFVEIFLGRPCQADPPECRSARQAFDAGNFPIAMRYWPRHYSEQRRVLGAYMRKRNAHAAVAAVDQRLKRLFVSAFQSEIFNCVLSRRLDGIDAVMVGDLAQKIDTGGIFPVRDLEVEQTRAAQFEISPTGPIVGYRCNFAEGQPGKIERQVLEQFGLSGEAFRRIDRLKAKGSRRALRFAMDEAALTAGKDAAGEFIELAFVAPSGCYATIALREIMKSDVDESGGVESSDNESERNAE